MSYTPMYFQPIIWVAELENDEVLREFDDDGESHHAFIQLERNKLRKFHLISRNFDYFVDCKTGVFNLNGLQFIFPLACTDLNFKEGLIHYKQASTHFVSRPEGPYDGFGIQSFNIGWHVKNNDLAVKVILILNIENYPLIQKLFDVEMTLLDLQKKYSWNINLDPENL
jgi:hypothetical protein